MANYKSKYTGEQIEEKLDLLEEENFKAYLEELEVSGLKESEVNSLIQSAIGEAMGGDY